MSNPDWRILAQDCARCQRCALADVRRHAVFGSGNPDADILIIGDIPSVADDGSGAPFVGESSRILHDLLALVELDSAEDVYLTTLVKCHPLHGRPPLYTEQTACMPHLRAQFRHMKPKLTLCLGALVAERILGDDFDFSTQRGQIVEKDGFHFVALHHPRDLLENPNLRPESYADWRALCANFFHSTNACTQ